MMSADAIKELVKAQAISAAAEVVSQAIAKSCIAALPTDFVVADLEKYMPTRRRLRGSMDTPVTADFAVYATKNAEEGAAIFIDPEEMKAVAVLNLGTPDKPGHADNVAILELKRTATYSALRDTATGKGMTQCAIAEFIEDWATSIKCFNDAEEIPVGKAISLVRKITIESLTKKGTEVQNLSASKSAFEQVQARSGDEPLPTTIFFTCKPYSSLPEREFVLRLGILTGGAVPAINLRIIKIEEHEEQMAEQFASRIRAMMGNLLPITLGEYITK